MRLALSPRVFYNSLQFERARLKEEHFDSNSNDELILYPFFTS